MRIGSDEKWVVTVACCLRMVDSRRSRTSLVIDWSENDSTWSGEASGDSSREITSMSSMIFERRKPCFSMTLR